MNVTKDNKANKIFNIDISSSLLLVDSYVKNPSDAKSAKCAELNHKSLIPPSILI